MPTTDSQIHSLTDSQINNLTDSMITETIMPTTDSQIHKLTNSQQKQTMPKIKSHIDLKVYQVSLV